MPRSILYLFSDKNWILKVKAVVKRLVEKLQLQKPIHIRSRDFSTSG